MWSRSFLRGQPTEWVRLPGGRVVTNVMGLCLRHHKAVTGGVGGHMAMIKLEGDYFLWLESNGPEWENLGPLFPQPWSETPLPSEPLEHPHRSPSEAHLHLEEGETCDSCGYTRPTKRVNAPKRSSKTYSLVVPEDSEIGADILDEWVEQFAVVLGFGDDLSSRLVRYHVFVAVFAWAMQNRQQFIEDVKEAMKT